jgi:hypothetical protein
MIQIGTSEYHKSLRDMNWKAVRKKPVTVFAVEMDDDFIVLTREGTMSGKKGDFLMRGVLDELYPCEREIFKRTYEDV